MCGIYGTTLKYSDETVGQKLTLMNFRGPDHMGIQRFKAQGSRFTDEVTLGHVRLSIIDLDARSNQPFVYNENISIVFNGEVYNYKELKRQYLSDIIIRTESDTEVICAMYDKFGIDSVKYFNGMFAFVIFDRGRNVLVGARDRLGKKPFYYWHSDKGFEFASQLKVIKHGNVFHVDELSRQFYCLHGYIPDPHCIFSELKKLRAGQCFTYSITKNELNISQYWDIFSNSCGFKTPKSYEEAKETVKELLYDSVRLRLNADVPVGVFLSGGIDSSLVAAIASKYKSDINAYTIGFEDSKYDESPYARDVAKAIGMPITISLCKGKDQEDIFEDYIDYYDEPFCDPSMIPSSLVAQKARENVTCVLGGDGGDELFFGYTKYLSIVPRIKQYQKPYWLRRMASPYFLCKKGKKDMIFSTQRHYEDVYRSEGIFCYDFQGAEKFDRVDLAKKLPDRDLMRKDRGVLAYCDYDLKFFLNAMNQKVDRATMRSSLELRNPLMDYRLAEYSRLLPIDYMYTKQYGLKGILKDILYEMLPRELLDRPKKGFSPPTETWFRNSLKQNMLNVITEENLKMLLPELDGSKIIDLRDRFLTGKSLDARIFWSLYTYINWYNKYNN